MAVGANMKRVKFLRGPDGKPFDPARDIPLLREECKGRNISMLIIDPIISVAKGDSHNNAGSPGLLQPVLDLMEEIGCSTLGIHHLTKGTAGSDLGAHLRVLGVRCCTSCRYRRRQE